MNMDCNASRVVQITLFVEYPDVFRITSIYYQCSDHDAFSLDSSDHNVLEIYKIFRPPVLKLFFFLFNIWGFNRSISVQLSPQMCI